MATKNEKTFKAEIRESDRRIAASIRALQSSPRGSLVLANFKRLMQDGATGLDGANWMALQTLVNEAAAGRRDFLDTL